MLKKLVIAIMCCLPFTVMAQTLKFGTVKTQELFAAMPETVQAESQLQEFTKRYEDEFLKLQEDFQKKFAEVQAMGDTVPETIKMRRYEELETMQQRIESFQQVAQQDIVKKQQELMAPIQQKLMLAIQEVGSENGFTYIFDAAQPVYIGTSSEDVTPLVKKKLGIQ